MNLATLRNRARSGSLEVEHILAAAVRRLPGLAEELKSLSHELGWKSEQLSQDGVLLVPLARWADVAAAYASEGFPGLSRLSSDPGFGHFVIGLVEEIKTADSLNFLLTTFANVLESPAKDRFLAFRLAQAINLWVSIPPPMPAVETQAVKLRVFLEALYPLAESEAERALAVMALRGVGNEASIEFVAALPEFTNPWQQTKSATIRAIRKKLRQRTV